MKKYVYFLAILICLLLPTPVFATWSLPFSEDCESGTYPYDGGFEAEFENNGGTATEYTGANKNGTKSVDFDSGATANSSAQLYIEDESDDNSIYAKFSLWVESELLEDTNTAQIVRLYDANCVALAANVHIVDSANTLYLGGLHGGVTTNDSTYEIVKDTEYIVKVFYQYSTGSDGILRIWIRTPTTAYGDPKVNITTGTDTDKVGCVRFGIHVGGANDNTVVQQDDWEVSSTDPDPDGSYYVDATSGDDENMGSSTSDPWQTIAKVNSFSLPVASTVYFKKGETWREQLTVPTSGTSGNVIEFTSYDSGADPIINGSDVISGNWTPDVAAETGDLLDEGFEGTGYENTWGTAQVGDGSFDPDNTAISPPTDGGSEVCRVITAASDYKSYNTHDMGSENGVVYIRLYVYIAVEDLDNNDDIQLCQFRDNSNNNVVWFKLKQKADGDLCFFTQYYDNGNQWTLSSNSSVITTGNWYKLEFKWDDTTPAYDFVLDDVSQDSGALSGSLSNGPQHVRLGNISDPQACTIYFDRLAVDSTGFLADSSGEWSDDSVDTEVESVYVDGTEWFEGTAGSLDSDEWDWTSADGGTLFLGADPSGHTIEASQRQYCIYANNKDYITIDGLQVQYAKDMGMQFWQGCDYVTVQNCTATKCRDDGIIFVGTTTASTNNTVQDNTVTYCGECGISFSDYTQSSTLQRNTVSYCGINPAEINQSGIKLWADQADTNKDNIVQYNEVHHNGCTSISGTSSTGVGIWVDECWASDLTDANIVRHNYSHDNGAMGYYCERAKYQLFHHNVSVNDCQNTDASTGGLTIGASGSGINCDNNYLYNNSVYGSGNTGILAYTYDTGNMNNNTLKNNVIDGSTSYEFLALLGGANNVTRGSGNVYDSNCFGAEYSNFIKWAGTEYSTYDAFISASSQTDDNVEADPLYTNPGSDDLTLQSGSPCINQGENVGDTYGQDQGLDPASSWVNSVTTLDQDSYGAGWEMGAYVYEPTTGAQIIMIMSN